MEPELAAVMQQRHETLRAKGSTVKIMSAFNVWESTDYLEFGMAYFPSAHPLSASEQSWEPWQALGWDTNDFRNACLF